MWFLAFSVILGSVQLVASSFYSDYGWSVLDVNNGEWSEVLERDVCVIGGGTSGVHAAVSLIDANKTVVVVERNDFLGGGAHTYIDPETGATLDIGVVIFQPLQVVFDFFSKFNVSLVNMSTVDVNVAGQPANPGVPAAMFNTIREEKDFRDGSPVVRDIPSPEEEGEAFERLAAAMAQYPYLLTGYDLPDPIPEDLYKPFGAFVEKYNLSAAFRQVYDIAQGMGDLLPISTIYAIKYYNLNDIRFQSQGYFTQAQGNNSELYTRAGAFIGPENVLLQSTIISTNRQNTTSGRHELLVATLDGGRRLLSCNQTLLTIPPTLTNLRGWDLTPAEHAVFSQYETANGYWTGLVKNVGLNQTVVVYNSAQNTPFNIPALPALYNLAPVGNINDVWWVKFGSDNPTMTNEQVQSYVKRQINTIQKSYNATVTEPEWLIFESHTPFHLQVSSEAIKRGFFKGLTGLQGGIGGKMFYSGAAFHTQYSTLLWQFNQDVVIPKMLGGA